MGPCLLGWGSDTVWRTAWGLPGWGWGPVSPPAYRVGGGVGAAAAYRVGGELLEGEGKVEQQRLLGSDDLGVDGVVEVRHLVRVMGGSGSEGG